jgi:hypothetical protein
MTDYGKGAVLGAAAVLPATTAAGLFFADAINPVLIAGFVVLNVIWLSLLTGQISRYFVNRK